MEFLTDFVPFFNIKTDFVPFLTDFVPNNYYNVVSYVHIPLVPEMQERSEAERRAIWPCLNVATWRRERSDRAIQQIC